MSVKSSVSKGTKKKKKASNKAGHDGESNDSDTSRTQTIAPPQVVEEQKIEEPVIPERPRKQFIQPEKITMMEQGVDLLRQQLNVWD
jgi:hypothetical protein